jgi:very-short-patch-repair endonuclease
MIAADVDLGRAGGEGAKALRAFLDYAARGPAALRAAAGGENEAVADSPFEDAVAEELSRQGLQVHRRVGSGVYRIDVAISEAPGGRYLLGIECDGESYRSAATARDRDRLRRSVLEGLGWNLVRVWSIDWIRDRAGQVSRILAALELARARPTDELRRTEPMPAPELISEATVPGIAPAPVATTRPPEQPHSRASGRSQDSIEDVPEDQLHSQILLCLGQFGSIPADDLISAVSRGLGFKRVGPKIRDRVITAINILTAAGRVSIGADNRIKIVLR